MRYVLKRPEPEKPRSSWLSLLLAACLGLILFTGLVFLSLGWLALVLVIAAAVFGLSAFHYLVWGWWLSDAIRREEREAEARRFEQLDD